MKIVADESVDRPIVDTLRAQGRDVVYVAELAPGIRDDLVLSMSHDSAALLLTADKDFGELVYRQRKLHSGIALFRLAGLAPSQKAVIIRTLFDRYADQLPNRFTVVTERAIRLRRMVER